MAGYTAYFTELGKDVQDEIIARTEQESLYGCSVGEEKTVSKTGRVLRIEKTSIHDGEGLRTVVFLKGCPLRCKWCSTPESQRMEIEKRYGKDMTVEEVVKEICKDEIFFFHSGGGVTISGGEVLMQADFAKEILIFYMEQRIPTAIETSLYSSYDITD